MSEGNFKNCPFCGCEELTEPIGYHGDTFHVMVGEHDPDCILRHTQCSSNDLPNLIERWNTRAEMTPQQLAKQAEKMGYAVVPLGATEEMRGVAAPALDAYYDNGRDQSVTDAACHVYKAMIEAGRVKYS